MSRVFFICALSIVLWASARSATAQQVQVTVNGYDVRTYRQERLEEKHWLLTGSVELEQVGGDTKLYADEVEVFEGEDKVLARGNVVLTQGNNRIAADHAEFNTRTRLGTFYSARGMANIPPPRQAPQPGGIIVPTATGLDTDVYFFGETVEKLGIKKYKITNGGFSTCVQPTPRWELFADTVVLNVDHYTVLRQAVFTVKGVPVLYLPYVYYPTQEDGRATGFLLPTYGHTTIDGHVIHNEFFWAINRSMDATVAYDYLSKTGGRAETEYRYNMGAGANGSIDANVLNEKGGTYNQPDGSTVPRPAGRSFTVRGGANQIFPGNFRGRAYVDYFSSIITNQTYNPDVNVSTSNNRRYGGNVVGMWRSWSLNGTFDRTEWFSSTISSAVSGSTPRITLSRNERPLFGTSPLYFAMSGEAAHLDRTTTNVGSFDDRSVSRFDLYPQIRYPFRKWQWFTVNTSATWRDTFYTRSIDPVSTLPIDQDLNRTYFAVQAQAVGPVFTRVWDTPDNHYAERFKHTIEPSVTISRTSAIDIQKIIQIDGTDTVFGTTRVTYGLSNRLYAKRKVGQLSQAQEIVAFDINQSYYVDARAAQFDSQYTTILGGASSPVLANNYSPIQLGLRASPSVRFNANLRGEIDSRYRTLRTLSANGNYTIPQHLQLSVGWSRKFFVPLTPGYDNLLALDHYLNFGSTLQTRDNKYGVTYSANYDILRTRLLQQRISTFYNSQCCGIAFEYQRYNYAGVTGFFVPSDRRFFLSFTLAGLGNFSPVGGMNGGVRR